MRYLIFFGMCAMALALPRSKFDENTSKLNQFQTKNTQTNGEDFSFDESLSSLENNLSDFLKTSNFSIDAPIINSTIAMDARNLDNDELNLKFNFGSSDSGVEARKKSKIKKVFIPILVFILLKAIVLVPLALGILGIKTWNAIQLSFISFVSAIVLAIWKLCTKVNHDHPPAIIHNAWDPYHHHDRTDTAQQMAYSGYAPN